MLNGFRRFRLDRRRMKIQSRNSGHFIQCRPEPAASMLLALLVSDAGLVSVTGEGDS